VRRRPSNPPTFEGAESEQSFRQAIEAFRREPRREKLKIIGAAVLFLPVLGVIFLVGFFLFGGWRIFEDQLPAWIGRLFTFLVIVLIAWGFLRPVLDRIEGRDARRPPR
jgi:hypothetical protein